MKKKDVIDIIPLSSLPGDDLVAKADLDTLSFLCDDIRKAILDAVSTYGGHLSSNLGVVDAVVALHHCFHFPKDKLIFDVGHQCYAHKILSGRPLEGLRQKGGTSGFQKMSESPYDPYEAGHSSTALSAAEAMAIARDEKGEDYNVIAFVGDASIVNGLSFEALNSIAESKSKVIVVLNDNDMAISRPSGGLGKFFSSISTGSVYTKLKKGYRKALTRTRAGTKFYTWTRSIKDAVKRRLIPITMFDNLGYTYIGTVDGHNMKALIQAFERAKRSERSVVIHINTVKGKGYPIAEEDKLGRFHDVPPFEIETGLPKVSPSKKSWSQAYAEMVEQKLKDDPMAYLVVASTQNGSMLDGVMAKYPSQCIDMGIAEEHALTFAGALSLQGHHVIVSMYSTFLQRAYDELSHDCARLGANMTILVDRAGLVGANGPTHQGIYDVGMASSIPNLTVKMPDCLENAKLAFEQSFLEEGVTIIRYPKSELEEGETRDLKPAFSFAGLSASKKKLVVTVGPKYLSMVKSIREKNIADVEVAIPNRLLPIGEEDIEPLLGYESILVYDAYSIESGFASSLCLALAKAGYKGSLSIKAVPNAFLPQASVPELEEDLHLRVVDIIEEI